jgi:hypothetical protein
MLTDTLQALQGFDNQHDFERMAADILNHLGYADVEPMSPGGGSDGGQDIRFDASGTTGIAFVTLDKGIASKFKGDLAKQTANDGLIILFCNVNVSPAMKLDFTRQALGKGYRLDIFDLERLRSLLDSSLKDVRRRYLKIDNSVSEKLRAETLRLIRFPDATLDSSNSPTIIETLVVDTVPRRLFELLLTYRDEDISETPLIGPLLLKHRDSYYAFRQRTLKAEAATLASINPKVECRFRQAWKIYLRYLLLRLAGMTHDAIRSGGDFLNYGITWDDAERVFTELNDEGALTELHALLRAHQELSEGVSALPLEQ